MALKYPEQLKNYQHLHKTAARATTERFCLFKLADLHKTNNDKFPIQEWSHLNFDQVLTKNLLVGKNAVTNKLYS